MRASAAATLVLALAACPGPKAGLDARPVDAMPDAGDAGRCPGEEFLTGEYVDWDSTDTAFHGVAFATFQIDGDSNPAHMDQSSPNGRIEMCIPTSGRQSIKVTSATGDAHKAGHFIADPAAFTGGRFFSARGITDARAATFYAANVLPSGAFDDTKGQLLVHEQDTPVAVTLTGATAEATLASADGVTWAAGATGKYVLFANVTITGAPAISGPSVGAGPVPMQPGEWTMTSVIGQ